jgi:alpha-tubulin suppressor-like RCC1 family protein
MSGVSHACLVGSDGGAYCSGDNTYGQLGLGNTTSTAQGFRIDGVTGTVDLSAGTFHTCALRGDGTVRCWGSNSRGQLGDGTTTQRTSPVQVVGITDAVRVVAGEEHTCALRQTGTVSCWGKGTTLGDGLGLDRATPADVPNLSGVTALDSHIGRHTCAILADRTLKCWGENESAQVDGTQVWAARPTTVVLQ